jgi:hypothetical protein
MIKNMNLFMQVDMLAYLNNNQSRGDHATSHDFRNRDGVCDFAGLGSGHGSGELGTEAKRLSVLQRCQG